MGNMQDPSHELTPIQPEQRKNPAIPETDTLEDVISKTDTKNGLTSHKSQRQTSGE